MDIPASTNVHLSTSPFIGGSTEIYPSRDLCLAPHLHVLDEVSTASFSTGFDTIQLQVQNDSGGVLGIQVYHYENVMTGLILFSNLLRNPFQESPFKFRTTREFSLHIERGASRDEAESALSAVMFSKFISGAPSLELIKLCGVPARALSFDHGYLHHNRNSMIPFPNLQRLYIESTPLHSAESLLGDLDTLLRWRKAIGVPLQFVGLKVNCETLIPMAKHSAFLAVWEGLVEEDVKVEYSRDKVEKLPRRGLHLVTSTNIDGDGEEGEEEESDEAGAVGPGKSDSDWDSWVSEQWPVR